MAKTNGMATVLVAIVTLAVSGTGGYMLGARSAKPETKVVASVNGDNITQTALYERMVKTSGATTVDTMIRDLLVDQAAKKANVSVSAAEVDAEIEKIRTRIGGQDKLLAALQQYGISMDQLKDDTMFRLKATRVLSKDIATDDATLKTFFTENRAQFDKREAHTRHILSETEEKAKAVKDQLDKGADFSALAKEKSTDPSAKQNGGDMGFHKPGAMVPEYDKVVFSLKKGETSAPFKSQFGWHVAQLIEVKGEAPDFEKMKADIKEAYVGSKVEEKFQPWVEELKAAAKIENSLAPKETK